MNKTAGVLHHTTARKYKVATYMNNLLGKIQSATAQEDLLSRSVIDHLKNHLGEVTEDNIAKLLTSIAMLFNAFNNNHSPVSSQLLAAFSGDTQATAKKIVEDYAALQTAIGEKDPVTKLALYANDPIARLLKFTENLDSIEKLATSTTANMQKEMATLSGGKDITQIKVRGIKTLKHAVDEISKLEVPCNAN